MPHVPRRRLLFGAAGTALTLVALARTVDGTAIRDALGAASGDPLLLLVVAAVYTLAFWLRALAWRGLLTSAASTARLFSILQFSLFLNHVLPLRAGEVARPALAARHGVPLPEAASTTVVARLLDFATLAAVTACALPAVLRSGQLGVAFLGALLLTALALLALAAVREGLALPLPGRLRQRAEEARAALRAISPGRVAATLPLIVASWVLESAVLLGAARLLGVEIPLAAAVGATAFAVLFQIVHLTPGGLGVYEASMTSVLVFAGVRAEDALALAVLTHGLKFAYSLSVGLGFAAFEGWQLFRRAQPGRARASRFELVAARLWNVLNEGKPFTPVFAFGAVLLLSGPRLDDGAYLARAALAVVALVPLGLVWWRFDFPLRLRAALWVALAAFLFAFRALDVTVIALVLGLYLGFTVVLWGTVYYHLRIGTRWTNFTRFTRLVLENPDPTSGNFLEQAPKLLLLVLAFDVLVDAGSWHAFAGVELFTLAIALAAVLVHQWWFTWAPALPQRGLRAVAAPATRMSRRVLVIAIDGCRADRLREARTPFLDALRAEGTEFRDVCTVYPARTVTAFASMLTGAPPAVHGMRSNFVPSLGVKCESVFDVLRERGMRGVLVGIAHLVDAFGERDVRTVSAVMDNEAIDGALVERAKRALVEEDPDVLVLQLLSVDQTGHARGSYRPEYLERIEATDRTIEEFLGWCRSTVYLEGATVIVTSDHGQGIGIGGHGHMSPPEINVPCLLWGAGVPAGEAFDERRFLTDVAATVCGLLGVRQPAASVGRALVPHAEKPAQERVAFVIPAHNEARNLPHVLDGLARLEIPHDVIVIDDGSSDGTGAVAAGFGAIVIHHEQRRGLGAALRTGLAAARDLPVTAAVYLDADGEYDPADAPTLLEPIRAGGADYVLGSRFRGEIEGMSRSRRAANHGFSLLLSLLCGRRISDGQTGYRAFSRRALEVAEIVHDYNYAQVLTLDLLKKGMRMAEAPVRYRRRTSGASFVRAEYLWRVPVGIAREMLGS
ncbi:MAG: lysylphosphatidylglycerol synthase domain-containing protein [Dehalococcoidia bacterium]